jgi:hypothetical protein
MPEPQAVAGETGWWRATHRCDVIRRGAAGWRILYSCSSGRNRQVQATLFGRRTCLFRPVPACFGYKDPLASQFSQRSEVICLPGTPRRASPLARATAPADWMVCPGLPRPCAGEAAVTNHKSVLQTGTTDPGRSPRVGVTSDGAESAPRLRVTYGEDWKESAPPMKRRVETHTASAQDSSTPVPWRWRSRGARIRGSPRPTVWTAT